ncbi:hypothetical protein MRX96_045789 [Rhipicephalus microplus]
MAASTKTGYDPSTMQWVDIEVAETREDPIPGEDEYLQIMVRQLQEKLAKMKPRGSTAATQPQARETGSTPAACVESPRQLAMWKPTHTPRIRSDELVIVLKPKITMICTLRLAQAGLAQQWNASPAARRTLVSPCGRCGTKTLLF